MKPTCATSWAANSAAALRARCSNVAAVRPPSRDPTTTRSGAPSATISRSSATFTTVSPLTNSVGAGQRLRALDVQDLRADRQRCRPRLRAQDLDSGLVVGVALAHLTAVAE